MLLGKKNMNSFFTFCHFKLHFRILNFAPNINLLENKRKINNNKKNAPRNVKLIYCITMLNTISYIKLTFPIQKLMATAKWRILTKALNPYFRCSTVICMLHDRRRIKLIRRQTHRTYE